MAGEWKRLPLGEFVTLQRGHDLPDENRRPGHVPILGSFGVTGWHDKAKARGPGVTVGRSGASFGVVSYSATDYWPLNTALYVIDFHGNDERFAYYFLKQFDFKGYNSGSAQPSLNRNFVHPVPVDVPPLAEQRAIAHILGTLDEKIELNRRMNETLEAMARALFKSWFVDFDPVRAKAEGRDPGLPKPLADLFPARLVDSELGEIPEGWEVAPLPEVVDVNPTRALRKGVAAPYLDMANMPTHGHSADEVVDRTFESGMRFINGDTLVARITPCLENGKTAFVDFLQDGQVGWGSTEYIVLRPKSHLPEEYAYCLARSAEFRDFAIQSMTGTSGRQRVPAESLAHFRVAVPSRPIADAFSRAVKPRFARASSAVRESRTLAALRDALLPKLISGDLRVKTAADIAQETSA
jgi:type I restriction enzyme S subunit